MEPADPQRAVDRGRSADPHRIPDPERVDMLAVALPRRSVVWRFGRDWWFLAPHLFLLSDVSDTEWLYSTSSFYYLKRFSNVWFYCWSYLDCPSRW